MTQEAPRGEQTDHDCDRAQAHRDGHGLRQRVEPAEERRPPDRDFGHPTRRDRRKPQQGEVLGAVVLEPEDHEPDRQQAGADRQRPVDYRLRRPGEPTTLEGADHEPDRERDRTGDDPQIRLERLRGTTVEHHDGAGECHEGGGRRQDVDRDPLGQAHAGRGGRRSHRRTRRAQRGGHVPHRVRTMARVPPGNT
jgi:hypothetical protein